MGLEMKMIGFAKCDVSQATKFPLNPSTKCSDAVPTCRRATLLPCYHVVLVKARVCHVEETSSNSTRVLFLLLLTWMGAISSC